MARCSAETELRRTVPLLGRHRSPPLPLSYEVPEGVGAGGAEGAFEEEAKSWLPWNEAVPSMRATVTPWATTRARMRFWLRSEWPVLKATRPATRTPAVTIAPAQGSQDGKHRQQWFSLKFACLDRDHRLD